MQADKIGTGTVTTVQALTPRDEAGWQDIVSSTGRKTTAGVRVSHRSAMAYPPVWRGVNLLANAVANLPVEIYRRDGDDRTAATSHPIRNLLRGDASPVIRARKLRQTMQAQALLYGNSYAHIERDGTTFRPVALWPLDPSNMMIRFFEDDLWYVTTIAGEVRRFSSREILHLKGLSHNGVIGYDVVTLMADKLGIGIAAGEFGARFFGQGSQQSGILMIPGTWKDEKIRNTMSAWNQMATGITKWHKIALLQDGVKWQPTSVAPNEAQFLETREFEIRASVASILGVPPHLLGDSTKNSYNSLEQENTSFLRHSLDPWLREWEDEYNCKLLSEREKRNSTHYVEFNREASVSILLSEKIGVLSAQMETGLLNLNEARAKMNEPGVGRVGEIRYRPTNWVEAGSKPAPNASPAPPPVEDSDENAQENANNRETPETPAENALRTACRFEVRQAQQIETRRLAAIVKRHDGIRAEHWPAVRSFYDGWIAKTAAGFESPLAEDLKTAYADASIDGLRESLAVDGVISAADVEHLEQKWIPRGEQLADALFQGLRKCSAD